MSSMSKQEVKCRCCGHRILSAEIMRTDLYERAPGQNYVYIKFRCRRCKRLGQTFVPEARWDWTLLEPARDELSEVERDRLSEVGPITDAELLDFHLRLKALADFADLHGPTSQSEIPKESEKHMSSNSSHPDLKIECGESRQDEKPKDEKLKDEAREARRGANGLNSNGLNANGLNSAGSETHPEERGNHA